jgi:hypothetical protein
MSRASGVVKNQHTGMIWFGFNFRNVGYRDEPRRTDTDSLKLG